jgi:hypothetical protein
VVEVQVREHDDIDVLVFEARRAQRIEQHVAILDDAVAFAQLGFEERTDAGLEQHGLAVERLASRARHASAMRFSGSGADQRDHKARGALPNIAPPSSFCELPRIDQSFMRRILAPRRSSFANRGLLGRVRGEMEHEGAAFGRLCHANGADRAAARHAPLAPPHRACRPG